MLYLSILLFISCLALTYKQWRQRTTFCLYGLFLGWFISIFSYALYISKFNVYSKLISGFYTFNKDIWNFIVIENFNSITLIRLMNIGLALFTFSFVLFILLFTLGKRRKNLTLYIVSLFLLMLLQTIYYDPAVQLSLQDYFYSQSVAKALLYNRITDLITIAFRLIKIFLFILSFVLLIQYFYINRDSKHLKNYTLVHILCLLPISLVHFLIFFWTPKVLVKATQLPHYPNFIRPPFELAVLNFDIFIIITFISFGAMMIAFSKLHSDKRNETLAKEEMNIRFATASLGVKTFTHSIKNHLLAIRSEAEYLKEKLKDDSELTYSVDLILKSCYFSYDAINNAANKLSTIDLTLLPTKLHIPVEAALEKFPKKDNLDYVQIIRRSKGTKVLMDEHQMTEVVYNIIKNAMEALHSQQSKEIIITIEDQDKWGCITISDNGPGIPDEHLHDVFSPFFSTKGSINNWGVGLSYCHKIVSKHQGRIEVSSIENKGSSFKILLPIQ